MSLSFLRTNINSDVLLIALLCAGAIFSFILIFVVAYYSSSIKKTREGKDNPSEWLLNNFSHKFYSALFGDADPEETAVRFGIDIEKYEKSCELTRTQVDVKGLVMNYVYGAIVLGICVILGILINLLIIAIGIVIFIYFILYEQSRLNSKATAMREQLSDELPRFLDLLSTELLVGLPVETAIYTLSSKFDSLLSKELTEALAETEMGVGSWQQALEKLAIKYDIETLSSFVLDVSTSYSKGVSITESVVRKTEDIKATHLLEVKERAGKADNTMLIPIAIFQFIPMMIYLCLPALVEVSSGLSYM